MKFIIKDERKDRRLIAYVATGVVIAALLGVLSGKPGLLITLVLTGFTMLGMSMVIRQTWYIKAANEAPRGKSLRFNAMRWGVAILMAIVLMTILHLLRK